jgi:hypothetical protein
MITSFEASPDTTFKPRGNSHNLFFGRSDSDMNIPNGAHSPSQTAKSRIQVTGLFTPAS